MFEIMKSILAKVKADYADIRHETKTETRITFNGKEITEIGTNTTDGYVLRTLKNGGFSSIAFTDCAAHERAITIAQENTYLMAKLTSRPVSLAKAAVVKDTYLPNLNEDPRQITLDEKLELTRKYNMLVLENEKIATTNINYLELSREKHFINTEGSEIREELITTRIRGLITSRDGSLIQNIRIGIGGSNGFSTLRKREDHFENRTRIVVNLLKAQPIKGGHYNVILNQSLGGVFAHEAFGHFSEADIIEDNPPMRQKMQIGAKLGNDIVCITDDPTLPDQLGHYRYDDEGVAACAVPLLKNGTLVGRLHSRRTAAAFQEPLNGHCVAEDYRYAPIIRMGTIFIEPQQDTFEKLLAKLGNGCYILDAKGGQTSGENFTFGAQYGYVVKDGKIGELVRDINISGNLYTTLKNITAVANDLELSQVGGCGKGQSNIRSCHGAPHILVNDVVIGGA